MPLPILLIPAAGWIARTVAWQAAKRFYMSQSVGAKFIKGAAALTTAAVVSAPIKEVWDDNVNPELKIEEATKDNLNKFKKLTSPSDDFTKLAKEMEHLITKLHEQQSNPEERTYTMLKDKNKRFMEMYTLNLKRTNDNFLEDATTIHNALQSLREDVTTQDNQQNTHKKINIGDIVRLNLNLSASQEEFFYKKTKDGSKQIYKGGSRTWLADFEKLNEAPDQSFTVIDYPFDISGFEYNQYHGLKKTAEAKEDVDFNSATDKELSDTDLIESLQDDVLGLKNNNKTLKEENTSQADEITRLKELLTSQNLPPAPQEADYTKGSFTDTFTSSKVDGNSSINDHTNKQRPGSKFTI